MTKDTARTRHLFDPLGSSSAPAGFSAPIGFQLSQDQESAQQIKKLASRILRDPLLQYRLCERVYELLQEDVSLQQERNQSYKGRIN